MKPQGSLSLVMQVKRKETMRDGQRHSGRKRREALQKPKEYKVAHGRQ